MAKSKFQAFTVFSGDEMYLLDREKRKALAWPDRMVVELEGKETTEEDIISALSQVTFDGTGVAVVLDDAEKVKLGKQFAAYLEERSPEDSSSVLVAIVRKVMLPKAWAEVAEKGRHRTHSKLKPWDTDGIYKRIQSEAQLLGLTLAEDAFTTLHKVFAENVAGMVNELRKLSFLVKKGESITKDHVLLVCPRQISVMPWDVSEAAAKRSVRQALTYAGLLFKYEGEGAAVPIVAAMQKQAEKLLVARSMLDRSKSNQTIAEALGMNPYVFEKNLLPLVHKHTVKALLVQMQKLCELETRVKGPAPSKRTLVELAVLSFAAA